MKKKIRIPVKKSKLAVCHPSLPPYVVMPPILAPLGPNLGPASPTLATQSPPQAPPATMSGQGLRHGSAASSPTAHSHSHPYRSPSSASLTAMAAQPSSGGIIHPPHSLEHLLATRRQLTMPLVDRAKYHRFLEQRMAYYVSLQPSINTAADRLNALVDPPSATSAPTTTRAGLAGTSRAPPLANARMSSSPLHHASPPAQSGSPAPSTRSRGGSTDYTAVTGTGGGGGLGYIRRQRTGSSASISSTATATGVHHAVGGVGAVGGGGGGGEGSTDGLVFNLSMTDLTLAGQQQQQQQQPGARRG
ncbi:hypothetical protein BCR44DRAFT_311084 [Catenaria anguillulae PL171]|uniref:Uncharacterized protein n=1 Tax=Catenaria anguillulae PL171 TaxID=765915 RepID=A0A1Y2HUM9_9FUNG|nr:hypothetical protein BCR44DRAFT_311084 [Catenaria anguillulae PL171]